MTFVSTRIQFAKSERGHVATIGRAPKVNTKVGRRLVMDDWTMAWTLECVAWHRFWS